MVVEAVMEAPTSIQCTAVPFKALLTESISNVEISGELLPWAEILMKVNVVEFTLTFEVCSAPSCEMNRGYS